LVTLISRAIPAESEAAPYRKQGQSNDSNAGSVPNADEVSQLIRGIPMTNQSELLPCPFCGGNARFFKFCTDKKRQIYRHRVDCANYENCRVQPMASGDTKSEAIKAWNTRADGWISVNTRLPTEEDADKWGFVQVWYSQTEREERWNWAYVPWLVEKGWVTHWRRITPPEEV
jgi:hypothetical protein